jgi:hypothetical protein
VNYVEGVDDRFARDPDALGLGFPPADILMAMPQKYHINIDWLISGEGEPFFEGESLGKDFIAPVILPIDPVEQLLNDEVERAGIPLTSEQLTAILKILRELVYLDVRSIQELLRSIPGEKQGDE